MNNTKVASIAQAAKDPASRRGSAGSTHGGSRTIGFAKAEGTEDGVKPSGIVQLMSNLHHNAAAVVTSKTKLHGPDQLLPHDERYTTVGRSGTVKLRREEHGLASEEPLSVPTLLEETAETHGEVSAMEVKRQGEWTKWTYDEYLRDVRLVARAYINIGLHRHHSVVVLGANSPEWVIGNLAAIFAGGIAVGLYPAMSSEEISWVSIDSKADLILVENEALLKRVLLIQHKLPQLKAIVQLRGDPPLSDKRRLYKSHKKHIVSWSQLLEIGEDLRECKLTERLRRVAINQCCSVVYTSGTDSGPIKGVMLSHDNITWGTKMILGLTHAPGFNKLPVAGEEIVMSYLPYSSIAAQISDIFYSISVAGTLVFATSDEYEQESILSDDDVFFAAVEEVNPTVFFGPPSIYVSMYHRLRQMKRATSGVQHLVLDWSNKALKSKHMKNDVSKGMVPTRKISAIRNAVAKNAVTKRYKEYLGFKPQTAFFCRGATLSKEVLEYLAGFDILVHETYGQTETSGLLCANIPKRYCKLGTTGKAMPGIKTQVDHSGDHLVRTPMVDGDPGQLWAWGRNIFMGYLNKENETRDVVPPTGNPDEADTVHETSAAIDKRHWLKLGDLGYNDEDEFMVILGKPDEFVTLATREIICPGDIEQLVCLELPPVKQAMVVGDGQGYLSVLLTLHTNIDEKTKQPGKVLTDEAKRWFKNTRFKMETVDDVLDGLESGVQHAIQAGIDRVNQSARSLAHEIMDWRIMPLPFTYASGELGLTGKLRRRAIMEKHAACIQSMFIHRQMHAFNSKCEANMAPQPHQPRDANLSLIKEEDETKTSRNSSPKQPQRRCQSQILLKSKFHVKDKAPAAAVDSPNLTDVPDSAAAAESTPVANKTETLSEKSENKPLKEHSESEDDAEDDDVDPEVKEKERKLSEQRILAIVHSGGVTVTHNETPKSIRKNPANASDDDDGLIDVDLADENKNEVLPKEKAESRKISEGLTAASSTVAINSQRKTIR